MIAERETVPADYEAFLDRKRISTPEVGFEVPLEELNPMLFEWQRLVVRWALKRGRAALFADCGLGKTPMQLEWAKHVSERTFRPVLIVAPLAVAQQTKREGEKFGVEVQVCRRQQDVRPGVNVTNYERLEHFSPDGWGGIVLDESSVLKGNGPLFRSVCAFAVGTHYRLACTATPAPNDHEELINHSEWLGLMNGTEALALWFKQDGNTTHRWRLKAHAERDFWDWVASWAVAIRSPADLGYPDDGFVLPPLHLHQHTVEAPIPSDALFQAEALGIQEQRKVRRETLAARVAEAARIVNSEPDEPWVVWCDLNDESEALRDAIPGAVEVTGSQLIDIKESRLVGFAEGRHRAIVSKPQLAGFGMNWQHAARMVFVGLGNSYERYYQAIRREWRFGQQRPVEVHVITSEADGPVCRNIERKEAEARKMMSELVSRAAVVCEAGAGREEMEYREDVAEGRDWKLYLGDCVKRIQEVEASSVGLCVFSPPFPGMYTYTNSVHDIGNTRNFQEMMEHFDYLIPELLRVTMPGRSCGIHLAQCMAQKNTDGYVGLKDFRGHVIRAMEAHGWHYYGEVTIDKDPQLKAIRTKDRGLLFKTLATDSSHCRQALGDYLLQFRKPGDNPEPIRAGISSKYGNDTGWITQEEWIRWARPVWYAADWAPDGDGIRETDVLSVRAGREEDDDKHLCPLQLGVIRRAILLWSNPGDLILSPFAGIGSEGYVALKLKRRFVGVELKHSYWQVACRNLRTAEHEAGQPNLLDLMGVD